MEEAKSGRESVNYLSANQMAAILDNEPVAIYVNAVDSRELLYANQMARNEFLNKGDKAGLTCYEAAGFDEPCWFCREKEMNRETLLSREFRHPVTQRSYQLCGKIIDWDGRDAHIEYIMDITDRKREEDQSNALKEQLESIFSSIPGGLCVYRYVDGKIFPVYHNTTFYEIMGYSEEHIKLLEQSMDFLGVHPDDRDSLAEKIQNAVRDDGMVQETYRVMNDQDGMYHWIYLNGSVKKQPDGTKLLYGIYSDVSRQMEMERELAESNEKLQDTISAIPGGVASYVVEGNRFIHTYFSDGIPELTGHSREEYAELVRYNAFDAVYEQDRESVYADALACIKSGEVLDVSFRMRHKNGSLVWVHLNGQRMGPRTESTRFYAVFTGLSGEMRLFQNIVNNTVDGIYVIDKRNYDLLYTNESKSLFMEGQDCVGRKCYAALHGKTSPCEFCTLSEAEIEGKEHEMVIDGSSSFYSTRFIGTEWNGIPAYVKFVRDVTEEVKIRREKERLEEYFQTVVKNLPGGVAVVRYEKDGIMVPEFMSEGFAALTKMSMDEVWDLYKDSAMTGVHPDDQERVKVRMNQYVKSGESHCEIIYRLKQGDGTYVWVKNSLSMIQNEGGEHRVYAVYHDMTKEQEEQESLRRQYKEMILQHYRMPDPNALIIGHCNITRNRILEIIDHTDSDLLKTFGSVREDFFTGISSFIEDEKEREAFLKLYLNRPALEAFERSDMEQILCCYIKLPKEDSGRYVQFKVNLVETPDTGDITGILTVTDITEQIISDRILHQFSVTSYDFVIDLDLKRDVYKILTGNFVKGTMPQKGCHSEWVRCMAENAVVPKDREQYQRLLNASEIRKKLLEEGPYTFSYSLFDDKGEIRTKNMIVSAIDLRLGRVCLVRNDITDSLREQQGLLNVIAYTFELLGLINIHSGHLTLYTGQTILENLPPYIINDYFQASDRFAGSYVPGDDHDQTKKQFHLDTILQRLNEKPAGYDFVFPYQDIDRIRYKQVNVLWGDENHSTVCLVRADVTDMLSAERETKKTLEDALALAEEANQAKSDFLSAMSHDIRTPMNAIMGMTALANAHIDDKTRVKDCLQKISISSRHLLSLINDVLDMSKIERSKISLNCTKLSLTELTAQLSAIMSPQARAGGLKFSVETRITHECFYGDGLRINQILLNILSNAVKFTPEGGCVKFLAEEIQPALKDQMCLKKMVRYRFTVSDTGIGMSEEFLTHMFEPFARSLASARVEGTGLGLSITKGLVDLMGGSISAESRLERGSVFRVELEFEAAPEGSESHWVQGEQKMFNSADKKMFSGRCFLVAEDNAINAEILCEILNMYGAEYVVAADGAKVVELFTDTASGVFDAILMDIQMPVMNGYEATRAIREMDRTDAAEIPIIAMTANAFAEDVQASMEAGMTAHVAKPIDLDILCETLKRALRQEGNKWKSTK